MRPWLTAVLRLVWAAFLIATSLYCFLAYLPYTYYALIKAPVYDWMPWFAGHHALLYWPALAAGAVGYFPNRRRALFPGIVALLIVCGIALVLHPVLPVIQSDGTALVFALAALLLLVLSAMPAIMDAWPDGPLPDQPLIGYHAPALAAASVSLLALLGTLLRFHGQPAPAGHTGSFALWGLSLFTHVALAIVVVTAVNMLCLI